MTEMCSQGPVIEVGPVKWFSSEGWFSFALQTGRRGKLFLPH